MLHSLVDSVSARVQSPACQRAAAACRASRTGDGSIYSASSAITAWWLPEPIVDEHAPSPETQRELADDVSVAFLAVLERLTPEERAAFLLHDVFDYDYPEVAQTLGKAEAACRQMICRARARLRESRTRYKVSTESRERLLQKFLVAIGSGSHQAVMALLAE